MIQTQNTSVGNSGLFCSSFSFLHFCYFNIFILQWIHISHKFYIFIKIFVRHQKIAFIYCIGSVTLINTYQNYINLSFYIREKKIIAC